MKLQRAPNVIEFNDLLDKLGVSRKATSVSIQIGLDGIPTFTVVGFIDAQTWGIIADELPIMLKGLESPAEPDRGSLHIDENGHKVRPDRQVPVDANPGEIVPVCGVCVKQLQELTGQYREELTIRWTGELRCFVCRGRVGKPEQLKVMKAVGLPPECEPEVQRDSDGVRIIGGVRFPE